MIAPQDQSYTKVGEYILVIFDVRIPGIAERFSRERAAWGEYADVEMFDLNHPVLIVQSLGTRRPAA